MNHDISTTWPSDNKASRIVVIDGRNELVDSCSGKRSIHAPVVDMELPTGDRIVVPLRHYNAIFPCMWVVASEAKWRNVRNKSVREKIGFMEEVFVCKRTSDEHNPKTT